MKIPFGAVACLVASSEEDHGICAVASGTSCEPTKSLSVVSLDAVACHVERTNDGHALWPARVCSPEDPFERFRGVLLNAEAFLIMNPDSEHRPGAARLRRLEKPRERSRVVDSLHALTFQVRVSERVHRGRDAFGGRPLPPRDRLFESSMSATRASERAQPRRVRGEAVFALRRRAPNFARSRERAPVPQVLDARQHYAREVLGDAV